MKNVMGIIFGLLSAWIDHQKEADHGHRHRQAPAPQTAGYDRQQARRDHHRCR
jgi:hypothetical protein